LALSEETGEGTQKSLNLFFLFSGEMGMYLDNRIPIHQIHSCCYAKAQATEQIRQEPKDKGNEIPHIEKFGLQLIVIRGAKNIRSKYQLATDKAMTDSRHNDTPVWSCM